MPFPLPRRVVPLPRASWMRCKTSPPSVFGYDYSLKQINPTTKLEAPGFSRAGEFTRYGCRKRVCT